MLCQKTNLVFNTNKLKTYVSEKKQSYSNKVKLFNFSKKNLS